MLFSSALLLFGACKTEKGVDVEYTQGLQFALSNDGKGYVVTGWDWEFFEVNLFIPPKHKGKPVVAIGEGAFSGKKIINVSIPATVKTIEDGAFSWCEKLVTVTVAEDGVLEYIGKEAFFSCMGLKRIQLPHSIKTICEDAFDNCFSISALWYTGTRAQWAEVDCASGNDHLTAKAVKFNYTQYVDNPVIFYYYFINDEQEVCAGGFLEYGYSGNHLEILSEYKGLPVTKVADDAFCDYKSLISISIPASVKTIGADAFYLCTALENVILPKDSQLTTIGTRTFESCENLATIMIPDTVTEIGARAFASCTSLTTVTLPNGLLVVSKELFDGCSGLESVTIPASVTTIDTTAFSNCSSLKKINYRGSKEQWDAIASQNPSLSNVQVVYNYKGE